MANSNGWGDGSANNAIGWGQGADNVIGWGDSHSKSWAGLTDIVGIDSDAQAFITAAAITDTTQQMAINSLVNNLKAYGIWTKMKAVYPFVGGTASTHKFNLKDPRDLDAAFRLVFNGGWTHSSTGATPNGTNGFADTKFNQENNWSSNTNAAFGFYSRSDVAFQSVDIGALTNSSSGTNGSAIYSRYNTNLVYWTVNGSIGAGVSNSNSLGLFIASRNNSTQNKIYKFGTTTINATQTSALSTNINRNIYLGAANDVTAGTAASYSPRQQAFAFISDGLNDTEAANFYTAVQAFQTALNRQV